MAPPAGARCAKHTDAPAVDVCQRCGSFVCSGCIEIRNEDVYCADCAKVLDQPPSKLSRVLVGLSGAWLLALLSMLGVVAFSRGLIPPIVIGFALIGTAPLAALMVALWVVERQAQKRETPSRGGQRRLKLAAVLIAINVLVGVAVAGGFVLFVLRQGKG